MASPTVDLAALYAGWPVERLIRAAFVECDDYAPEAVQVMRRVLESKGVSQAEIDAVLAIAPSKLNDIRGWLLAFVIHVAIVTTTYAVGGAVLLFGGTEFSHILLALISAAVAAYGAYCCHLLTSRRPEARAHAIGLMAAWGAASVASAVIHVVSGLSPSGGRPLLFALLWTPYLLRSKRVAMVYRRSGDGSQPSSAHWRSHA
jgi:hypothetical protein